MKFACKEIGDWKVFTPQEKRIDAAISKEFKTELAKELTDKTTKLILDMHLVEFIDTCGLGAIIHCLQKLEDKNNLALSGINKSVKITLKITRLDQALMLINAPEDVLGKDA